MILFPIVLSSVSNLNWKSACYLKARYRDLQMKLQAVDMDFTYQEAYTESLPEAYEALLLDVLHGDATLFMRADQVEAAWKVVMPILKAWKKYPSRQLHFYKAGTWGPKAAYAMLKPYATKWFQFVQKDMPVSELLVLEIYT